MQTLGSNADAALTQKKKNADAAVFRKGPLASQHFSRPRSSISSFFGIGTAAVPSLSLVLSFVFPASPARLRRHHTLHSPRTEGEGDGPGAFGAAAAAGGGAERAVERAAVRAERGRAGAEAAGARHH